MLIGLSIGQQQLAMHLHGLGVDADMSPDPTRGMDAGTLLVLRHTGVIRCFVSKQLQNTYVVADSFT